MDSAYLDRPWLSIRARTVASFHRKISLYKRLTPIISSRNITSINNEKSTHIRTQQILIRKNHEAFRGASVCTQIVRRIKNATSYVMQHHPDGKDQRLSHRDADKWLKRNNSELYTKLPSAIAQRSTQIVGQEWKAFYRLSGFQENTFSLQSSASKTTLRPQSGHRAHRSKRLQVCRRYVVFCQRRIATDQNAVSLHSQGKYAHIRVVTNKRNRRIKDLLHRASSKVASYCLENNIGTLVIGYNKHWNQEINIGRVNNQKFVGIPHASLRQQS